MTAVPDLDRIEDEGLTPRQMDEERARDEAERDENGETE